MIVFHIGRINQNNRATGPDQSIRALTLAQSKLVSKVLLIPCFPINNPKLLDVDTKVALGQGPRKKHLNPWLIPKKEIDSLFNKHGKPDIVNFHGLYSPFSAAFSRHCQKLGIPYIITPRGEMTPQGQSSKKTKKTIANFLCFNSFVRNASAIQALTDADASLIKEAFKVNSVFTCPNGVSGEILNYHSKLTHIPFEGFIKNNDLCVGYIGRIDIFQKGIDVLLESFSLLKKKNIKLVIIGPFRTKNDQSVFAKLIEKYNLSSQIKVIEPKYGEEKFSYLLSFDMFIHTSRFEGMPMSILEAMAMQKPCLVTPGTNIGEMVQKGGGWQCSLDAKDISKCLASIQQMKKTELLNRGKKSYALVKEQYTWKDIASCNIDNYKRILHMALSNE